MEIERQERAGERRHRRVNECQVQWLSSEENVISKSQKDTGVNPDMTISQKAANFY